jgi:sortase A
MDAYPPPKSPNRDSNTLIIGTVFLGMLVIFFALGKGVIDVATMPPAIDLAADDSLEAGFLPVYAAEGASANPDLVSIEGGAEVFPTPQPGEVQPTAVPGEVPDRLVIPVINLDATVIPISYVELSYEDELYQQWLAPDYRAVGWHETSAGLGVPGNTVLNGHHNIKGEVFRDLYRVQRGDEIDVYSGEDVFRYVVVYTAVVPERNQPLEVRLANAEWIQPTEDERLTIITCWPYESNTHRVIVVAVPLTTGASTG